MLSVVCRKWHGQPPTKAEVARHHRTYTGHSRKLSPDLLPQPARWYRDRMYGIELLLGAEINILDTQGTLDLDEFHMNLLDLRIAGIHSLCYTPGTPEENTQGMIKAIENPYTHIISHPGDGTAKLLFEPIVQAAKAHHTLLEINNSSLKPCRNKVEARPNNLEILRLCKQYEVPVILGSDAHISFDIATYDHALELVKETEFPESLILNTDVARF